MEGSLLYGFAGHDSWVLSVAAHPSGTCFVSGGSDAKVRYPCNNVIPSAELALLAVPAAAP